MKRYNQLEIFVIEFRQTDIITDSLTDQSTSDYGTLEVIIEDVWD